MTRMFICSDAGIEYIKNAGLTALTESKMVHDVCLSCFGVPKGVISEKKGFQSEKHSDFSNYFILHPHTVN